MQMQSLARFMLSLVASLAWPLSAAAQSFTYQGRLTDNGQVAEGSYDLELRVYDLAFGGAQQGATTTTTVSVSAGVFTALVNPGTTAFPGADRWLEVRMRRTGSGSPLTVISPRQRVTAAPYAIRSLTDRWNDLGNGTLTNSDGLVQRITLNRSTPVTGADYLTVRTPTLQQQFGGMYIDTAAGDGFPFYGYATGGAVRAYTYLDGVTGSWILFNGAARLNVTNDGRIGVGASPSTADRLQVNGDTRVSGVVTANLFRFAVPVTHVLNITAADFKPVDTSTQGTFHRGPQFFVDLDPATTSAELTAPLHLPQNAVITEVRLHATGSSPVVTADVIGIGITDFTVRPIASVSATLPSQPFYSATPVVANATIDNENQFYAIQVRCSDWSTSTRLRAVRIFYTVQTP